MLTFLILFLLTGALFFFLGVAYGRKKSSSHHYIVEQCPECNGYGKSRRFVLDITSNYSPRLLISEIRKAFENDNELTEVLIYKGKKEIVINRNYFTNRNVIKDFIRDWAK